MTTIASRPRWAPADHDEFLALICADQELLRAEFDSIVAEQWSTTRPHRSTRTPRQQFGITSGGRPPFGPRRRRPERRRSRPRRLAPAGRPSQRSPPLSRRQPGTPSGQN